MEDKGSFGEPHPIRRDSGPRHPSIRCVSHHQAVLTVPHDPNMRLSSFRSWRNRLYRPDRQGRILCRILELQQCDHRMDRFFNGLRYRDHHHAHDDFGTFNYHL